MPCMFTDEECTTVKSIHTEHEWVLKLTAIVLLLWVLRWGLHTKALSHDPAPEGPLPVLHPETCTEPWTDKQLHLPSTFLSPDLPCLRSFLPPCVSLVNPFSTPFTSVLPPSHNLLKTFPPCRSWTPSPPRSLTLPPWLTAQVSIHWKMPAIPGRRTSYVFNLMRVLRYAVQCVHSIMCIQM